MFNDARLARSDAGADDRASAASGGNVTRDPDGDDDDDDDDDCMASMRFRSTSSSSAAARARNALPGTSAVALAAIMCESVSNPMYRKGRVCVGFCLRDLSASRAAKWEQAIQSTREDQLKARLLVDV